MLLRILPIFACVLLTQIGCNSMSSTMLTRDESNQFWTRKDKLKGVPITLKVPTHVQLTVFERHFLMKSGSGPTRRLSLPFVVRDFSQDFIYGEKIFTVDFKRPAAGLYNLHLDLTEDQYIHKLQYDITDQTISAVTDVIGTILPEGRSFGAAAAPPTDYFEEVQSVVAVAMFDIDAPDFEEQMMAFVNHHLNQAHDAWIAQPDVAALHRAPLSGFKQPSNVRQGLVFPDAAPTSTYHYVSPPSEILPPPTPTSQYQ